MTPAERWADNVGTRTHQVLERLNRGEQPTDRTPAWLLQGLEDADLIYFANGEWHLTAKTPAPRKLRKVTKFEICPTHQGYFAGLTRSRKADYFSQGGPGHGPACSGDGCQIKPGLDLYLEDWCADTYNTRTPGTPFTWRVNEETRS